MRGRAVKGGEADRFAGYKGRRALIFAQKENQRENGREKTKYERFLEKTKYDRFLNTKEKGR